MQNTTQPYLAYRLSGNPFDLGLIGMASTLPMFFLALPGGVLVERFDKRKTVIVMQAVMMLQAFLLAAVTLLGIVQIWHIVVLSFLLGVASAIEITARQAMLVELVGKEYLPNAIALQATVFQAARVIGPAMMVPFLVMIKGSGEGYAFLANGISYMIVIAGLFFVRTPFKMPVKLTEMHLLTDLKESMVYIRNTKTVGMIIIMAMVFGTIGFPLLQQLPVFGRDVLASVADSENDIATRTSLLFTFLGFGALIAAFSLAAFNPKRKGLLLLVGQLVFTGAVLAFALSKVLPFSLGFVFLVGLGMVSTLATMNTLIQVQVPNDLRGRVFSTYLWGLQGLTPFGSLAIGWMATIAGIQPTTLVAGCICLIMVIGIQYYSPEIRKIVD